MRFAVVLAAVGAVLIPLGVAFVFWPAALVVAGVELLAAGYVAAYVGARKAAA